MGKSLTLTEQNMKDLDKLNTISIKNNYEIDEKNTQY